MKHTNEGFDYSQNAQAVVDAEVQIVAAAEVTNAANDIKEKMQPNSVKRPAKRYTRHAGTSSSRYSARSSSPEESAILCCEAWRRY